MLRFAIGVGLGLLAGKVLTRSRTGREGHVRVAGTSEMRIPPRQWDAVDGMADESFPASDPPGTY